MTQTYGRPTQYGDIEFRSRLEAEYAALLDSKGFPWAYEPKAYASTNGSYLPDFRVDLSSGPLFVETKGECADLPAALKRMHTIIHSVPEARLLVVLGVWTDGHYEFHAELTCTLLQPCTDCNLRMVAA